MGETRCRQALVAQGVGKYGWYEVKVSMGGMRCRQAWVARGVVKNRWHKV